MKLVFLQCWLHGYPFCIFNTIFLQPISLLLVQLNKPENLCRNLLLLKLIHYNNTWSLHVKMEEFPTLPKFFFTTSLSKLDRKVSLHNPNKLDALYFRSPLDLKSYIPKKKYTLLLPNSDAQYQTFKLTTIIYWCKYGDPYTFFLTNPHCRYNQTLRWQKRSNHNKLFFKEHSQARNKRPTKYLETKYTMLKNVWEDVCYPEAGLDEREHTMRPDGCDDGEQIALRSYEYISYIHSSCSYRCVQLAKQARAGFPCV